MDTVKYMRTPFEVDAIQVTAENIDEIAKWCQGEVHTDESTPYVKVHVARALNERQTKAYVGDWVLYAGTGFKVYTNKAFTKSFEKVDGVAKDVAVQAEKSKLPAGVVVAGKTPIE